MHVRSFFPWIKLVPKLLEIEKEIVCEVAWGDKHCLRKSADRKAQISAAFFPLISNWYVLCDLQIFLGSVYHLK